MTLVGKAKLNHPALGTAGGGTLHAAVETMFESISDHLPARWRLFESVADSATTTYEHNLQVPFADLRVHVYTKGVSSNTKVADLAAAGWSVVATTGFEQTKLDITAPSSGGPFDFYVYVSHEPMSDKLGLSGGTMTGALVLPEYPSYPTQATHAATKGYVDAVAQGLNPKALVKAATTANITLSGEQTIDGVSVVAGDRVLVKSQTTASQNGIYEVGAGAWSRAADQDAWGEVPGAFVFIEQGTDLHDTGWVCTSDQSGTIGTTAINWIQFAGVGSYTADGNGLELSGTQFALELDGTTLAKSASGLKVNPAGDITAASLSSGVINATGYQDFSPVAAPAAPTGKLRVYAKADNKLYTKTAAGIEQAVGSGGSVLLITKTGHGFVAADVGCPVYLNASGDYVKAKADVSATAEVAGLINKYIDADNFEVCLGGEVTSVGANASAGLTPGEVYFLSATTAGALVATEPTVIGYISKPVGVARSATAIDFYNHRGVVVGGANARSQLTLAAGTTDVQIVSGYDAGEMTGWVHLDGATDYKFFFRLPFAKNAAGTDYNISPSFVGETPPAGFSFSYASNYIRCTVPAGYTATVNYALNAPAVGTNFPLSLNLAQLVPDGTAFSTNGWNSGAVNVTMIASSPTVQRIASPASAVTVTLPTTGIKAGYQMKLIVSGATETNYVALQSSGANEIDRIGGDGVIDVVALQDSPTTAAHWSIINIQEKSTASLTFSSGAGTSAVYPASSSAFYSRNNKSVSIVFYNSGSGTTGSGSTTISINTATGVVPSRYRPTAASIYCASSCKEGTPGQSSLIGILTTGQIQVYKITESTWSTSVAFVPINGPIGVSYTLN
jgi:hypothetical protein